MLRHIEEFGKYVAIAGFREVNIEDVEILLEKARKALGDDVEVQFFDAGFVASWQHLYFAALNALKAFKNGENISKRLAVEVLLYASAQRQIRKATEVLGLKRGTMEVAVLVIGESAEQVEGALNAASRLLGGERDDGVFELTPDKVANIRRVFEISDAEIEAVVDGKTLEQALIDLVIERMALLATER
ncbi:MAG: KEOPS complex subunit Cgi121 [Candidatus Bathyarchaeia archaeon]